MEFLGFPLIALRRVVSIILSTVLESLLGLPGEFPFFGVNSISQRLRRVVLSFYPLFRQKCTFLDNVGVKLPFLATRGVLRDGGFYSGVTRHAFQQTLNFAF